jgi:hypothetical protein
MPDASPLDAILGPRAAGTTADAGSPPDFNTLFGALDDDYRKKLEAREQSEGSDYLDGLIGRLRHPLRSNPASGPRCAAPSESARI